MLGLGGWAWGSLSQLLAVFLCRCRVPGRCRLCVSAFPVLLQSEFCGSVWVELECRRYVTPHGCGAGKASVVSVTMLSEVELLNSDRPQCNYCSLYHRSDATRGAQQAREGWAVPHTDRVSSTAGLGELFRHRLLGSSGRASRRGRSMEYGVRSME